MASDTYEPQSPGLSSAEWSQQQQAKMNEEADRRYREAQQQASESLDSSHWKSSQAGIFANDPRNYAGQAGASINTLLADRATIASDFTDHARITQDLKSIMTSSKNWQKLRSTQRESLEMIAHKIGRILGGDPAHKDHWDDIAGYAELVAREL